MGRTSKELSDFNRTPLMGRSAMSEKIAAYAVYLLTNISGGKGMVFTDDDLDKVLHGHFELGRNITTGENYLRFVLAEDK